MPISNSECLKKFRHNRRSNDLCVNCGKPSETYYCPECYENLGNRANARHYMKITRMKRTNGNKCSRCGGNRDELKPDNKTHYALCSRCRNYIAEWRK